MSGKTQQAGQPRHQRKSGYRYLYWHGKPEDHERHFQQFVGNTQRIG